MSDDLTVDDYVEAVTNGLPREIAERAADIWLDQAGRDELARRLTEAGTGGTEVQQEVERLRAEASGLREALAIATDARITRDEVERLRAELASRRVEMATIEPGRTYVLRAPEHTTRQQLDDLQRQLAEYKPDDVHFLVLAGGIDFAGLAERQLAAEVERLRGLVAKALEVAGSLSADHGEVEFDADAEIARIEREAGLA